ncbi:hypothetical protein KP509_36G036300 [Ceratopteris richardii]|uniref:Uncharacterized protein n=1 Tax=Ceratopteris richardii TaxID=49495 RepID=A0A8T2QC39_CERRI|nr:hypothetical protein KP509_36G036300 [Ceratopteris richardii]
MAVHCGSSCSLTSSFANFVSRRPIAPKQSCRCNLEEKSRRRDSANVAASFANFVSRRPIAPKQSCRCNLEEKSRRRDSANVAAAVPIPRVVSSCIVSSIAASLVLSCVPAEAGILSGSSGLESIPFPALPTPESLKKTQEAEKARYEGFDANFKSSSLVQELLKRSEQNAEKHRREIQNKYCQRGADWGVGDCALTSMSEKERLDFMDALKGSDASQKGSDASQTGSDTLQ